MVSDEMLDYDIHLGNVHLAWTHESALKLTWDNSADAGLQRHHRCTATKIRFTVSQIQANSPAAAHVGCLRATIQVANSGRNDRVGNDPQESLDVFPISSLESTHKLFGI